MKVKRKFSLGEEGRYSLRRISDGSGDSGHLFVSIYPPTGKIKGKTGDIVVGCCIQCGSPYARTMQLQDWWMTTPVTEILETREGYCRFKTKNSEYEARIV